MLNLEKLQGTPIVIEKEPVDYMDTMVGNQNKFKHGESDDKRYKRWRLMTKDQKELILVFEPSFDGW